MAGRIFISYRRADTAYPAGWLFDRLVEHFGRHQVFKDVDSIELGDDFAEVIASAVASCDVLLVLIGHHWLTSTGYDGDRRLYDPNDYVRLEIESALTRDVRVIPVLIDGARMPLAAELPQSLVGLVRRQALELSPNRFDFDSGRLLRVLDQTISGMHPVQRGRVGHEQPARHRPPGQRRRIQPWMVVLAACGTIAVAIVVLVTATPGGRSGQPPPAKAANRASSSSPATTSPPNPAATAKIIVTDDFSTREIGWVDTYHRNSGTYTGNGAYRLTITGANGQAELASPANAPQGLGDQTPLNLDVSVDARKLSGAPHGYGYGIALRNDGGGNDYAFLVMDHAVAIQKWVGGGARVTGDPAPVSTSALHAGAADRLRAVCQTAADGTSVHLELWLNGTKMVDYTDGDHPYTRGYLGLYVETISDAPSTAAAEFDNFTAAQIRG